MKKYYPKDGRFGEFGGRYIPETLVPAIEELEENYLRFKGDKRFKKELNYYLKVYAGRPTPLYYAKNLSEKLGGAKIYLKREDLLHGGAHKINNTLGQALLAKKMNKRRIIAETGAGQHGVATAMACAALGIKAEVYMGYKDTIRQQQKRLNNITISCTAILYSLCIFIVRMLRTYSRIVKPCRYAVRLCNLSMRIL